MLIKVNTIYPKSPGIHGPLSAKCYIHRVAYRHSLISPLLQLGWMFLTLGNLQCILAGGSSRGR